MLQSDKSICSRTNVDNNPSRAVSRRRELDSLPFRFTLHPGLVMARPSPSRRRLPLFRLTRSWLFSERTMQWQFLSEINLFVADYIIVGKKMERKFFSWRFNDRI